MKRVIKSTRTDDGKRDRVLKRRAMECRAEVENLIVQKAASTQSEVMADFLNEKTTDDHITYRLLRAVFFGLKNAKYYPETKEEKYDEMKATQRLMQKINELRHDKNFAYLSIMTGISHIDPDTGDQENVIFNANKESPAKKRLALALFKEDKMKVLNTFKNGVLNTLSNAEIREEQRRKIERAEYERRKKKIGGTI